jgi:hypothetical protein
MQLNEIFAENLAELCKTREGGNIARICRRLNINRQQFQRYLDGTLPRASNLSRIAKYFGVDEAVLLVKHPAAALRDKFGLGAEDDECAAELAQLAIPQAPLPAGIYLTYFAPSDRRDLVVRSVSFVRWDAGRTTFRRRTGRWTKGDDYLVDMQGDHRGIVSQRLGSFYFCGVNRRRTAEPSMLVVRWAHISEPTLFGHATVTTPAGTATIKVVMTQMPTSMTARSALKTIGEFPATHATIPKHVARLLAA